MGNPTVVRDGTFADDVTWRIVTNRTTPGPLVMVLAGFGETVKDIAAASQFDVLARARQWSTAYVARYGRAWNAGTCCGAATDEGDLLVHLAAQLGNYVPVDYHRLYLAGFSNGGMEVAETLIRFPQKFAAGVSVGGPLVRPGLPGGTPVRFAHWHARDDGIVLPGGGPVRWPGAPAIGVSPDITYSREAARFPAGSVYELHWYAGNHTWSVDNDDLMHFLSPFTR